MKHLLTRRTIRKYTQEPVSDELLNRLMNEAARRLDFLQAAQYRDEVLRLNELLKIED